MTKRITQAVTGAVVGITNGLFGSGGGTILVPALEKFSGIEAHKAHATALAIIFPLSLLSVFIYTRGSETPWSTVMWISAGGVAGGFFGAKVLNKVKTKWLYKIFGICMIAAALRMIFR
ncbi:MAG: sulfite exporter TauE/SafE family protein [Clostridiales bacterium]|nr:sulfite exporter TauE/SafE family protein [Clostridiales bacterium]